MNQAPFSRIAKNWWKESIVYQIYPRSFMDSNNDGIGDLKGIISKLGYLKELGIDVIWICPVYKSPNDDNGYDISDYQSIMAEFGTMADFDQLLSEVHRHGMRLIIDLVVNHTSDEHPWFIESRSSRDNEKRDWYIWRDGHDGKEPNNWEAIFKGSAWEYDEKTQQYFMHLFTARQPDLNWENQHMRNSIYLMMRWWLDKGIDGFRIDAICHMKKDPLLSDMPNPQGLPFVASFEKHMNYDGLLDYVDDMSNNVFRYYDIMTVGEVNGVSSTQAEEWVGENYGRLNMIFQFEHVRLWDIDKGLPLDISVLKDIFTRWQSALEGKGWNALYLENHDVTRVTSRWGDVGRYWRESATAIAAMYFLMQGTPFIYQGQEIGMTNSQFSSLNDFQDVSAKNLYEELRRQGMTDRESISILARTGRDNSRTPMQWNAGPNAGFSQATPWLAVNENYPVVNVALQQRDPGSVLNFYRALIRLRKKEQALVYGHYELVLAEHKHIYAYTRTLDEDRIVVLCNLSGTTAAYEWDDISTLVRTLLLTNSSSSKENGVLTPWETRIYRLIK
ncbi:glycoside hydrolase family 13 protein [Sodalis sp. RH21]|uniref:glycoside hydrolase family 13 protein n=1 Tax=unclassified Sodalis (in: enterobacteria) TaxID=2636512 RepID=UPI0039B4A556